MSKIGNFFKVAALASAAALATQASAASFEVPINYTVKVVDGKTSGYDYNRFNRTLNLSAGRHQIVFLFEGNFGTNQSSRIYQAANPIVVEIPNMPANANYTFTYNRPRNDNEADKYTRAQKINLVNADTKNPLSQDEASYYILTSDSGFAILRDYRQDLASVGRLYDPTPVKASASDFNGPRTGMTNEGVQTVQAFANSQGFIPTNGGNMAMSNTVNAAAASYNAQNQAAAAGNAPQVQTFSSPAAAASYNQLVQLYESADANTKLQFVKYIMSH